MDKKKKVKCVRRKRQRERESKSAMKKVNFKSSTEKMSGFWRSNWVAGKVEMATADNTNVS